MVIVIESAVIQLYKMYEVEVQVGGNLKPWDQLYCVIPLAEYLNHLHPLLLFGQVNLNFTQSMLSCFASSCTLPPWFMSLAGIDLLLTV